MKTTLKTLTALSLICSAIASMSLQAEETLKNCDCGTVGEDYFSKCSQQKEAMKTSIPSYAFNLGLKTMESEIEKLLADFKDKIHLSSDIKKDCAALLQLISLSSVLTDTPQHLNKDEVKMFFRLKAKELLQGSASLSPVEKKVLTGLLHTQSDRKRINILHTGSDRMFKRIADVSSHELPSNSQKKDHTALARAEGKPDYSILGHVVSSAQKHLTPEENDQMRQLIRKGLNRKTLKLQEQMRSS